VTIVGVEVIAHPAIVVGRLSCLDTAVIEVAVGLGFRSVGARSRTVVMHERATQMRIQRMRQRKPVYNS
jgi:hypothetical protein